MMVNTRWHYKLIHWITIVFVAAMLPLSCIVHCHVHQTPVTSPSFNLFVCHPLTTVDADSPQHLQKHTVALRATHEVAIPLSLVLASMLLLSSVVRHQQACVRWYPSPVTPPPRGQNLVSQ